MLSKGRRPCSGCNKRASLCTCEPLPVKAHGWGQGNTRERRPDYSSPYQTKRRRAAVAAFTHEHCDLMQVDDGHVTWIGACPDCGQIARRWIADHVVPIAQGGSEDGELRVHCKRCSDRQGGRVGASKATRRTGKTSTHSMPR